ncbi:MAG TPA: sialidase family protein [Ktedonobacterales bacterium]|nr:sialidase family protein [Ktedonobacterales bacterium]
MARLTFRRVGRPAVAALSVTLLVVLAAAGHTLTRAAAPGLAAPVVAGNALVDQDHGLAFSQNKQNEPAITRDPFSGVLIAGANDEIQQPACPGTTAPLTSPCPFAPGVPTSGYYRSTTNGQTWTGAMLPGFGAIGRTSGGDPSLDYGPQLCGNGTFSFTCGVTIYYASLADPFPTRGGEQVTISRSHDDGMTWADPVQATNTDNKSNFDDHEWVAVDHSPTSPHFGRVHLFWAVFCNTCLGNGNTKLFVSHSDDEGRTWSPGVQVSAGNSNQPQGFRETGQIAVAANGTVEAFWTENADSTKMPSLQVVATSTDGGATFAAPVTIAQVQDYPLTGTPFDVVDHFNRVPGMSARVDCYPHPAADPGSTRVYVVWCDFSAGHGTVRAAVSTDGATWTSLGTIASVSGRNAFFPAASVAPNGTVSLSFDALTEPPAGNPWQTGVQVYDNYYAQSPAGGLSFGAPVRVSTASSNPQSTSYNNLQEQFIGDYIDIVSGPTSAYIVWTDARNAALCQAVDAYQSAVYAGSKTAVAPNPDTACSTNYGNSDTMAAVVNF